MPIQSYTLPAPVLRQATRKINELLRKEVLHLPAEDHSLYGVGFCIPIQMMPKQDALPLKLGKPEGIRVLVQNGNSVLAAVDLMYHGRQLKLTTVHQGNGLHAMLVMLNKLEKRYKGYSMACRPELIYFLLGRSPYMKVTAGKEVNYFHQPKGKLISISAEQLLRNIHSIIKHRQKLTL